MANPQVVTLQVGAGSANGIATAQAVAGAGNLTLNGSLATAGVATLTPARRVVIASSNAGDTSQTAIVTGTNRDGAVQTETLTFNGTTPVQSLQDFLTVTKIAVSAALAGNATSGTNGVASSEWLALNIHITPFNVSEAFIVLSGTVSCTVEHTYDDPNAPVGGYTAYPAGQDSIEMKSNTPPVVWPDGTIVTKGSNTEAVLSQPVWAVRLTTLSGTGKAMLQVIQAGIHQ